ncbi:MAG: DUF3341 domain-containing protein [Bacteroidota bacterium]
MSSVAKKFIYGLFNDDEVVLNAVTSLRRQGLNVKDVVSPFPIHGMDNALGLKRTRISICCFIYGFLGCCSVLFMIWYMNIFDWPMDIGGKPSFALYKNLPAFIPVTFEGTVLCAAHGMVITFYLRSKLLPGVEPVIYDLRQSDDHFVMAVQVKEGQSESEIKSMLMQAGAVEVNA